jgi:calcineurin-like phosphoesterase family protein
MKYYLITDTHFGHDMLIKNNHRESGYESVILKNLSKKSGDVLIHLGDICIGKDEEWHKQFMEATKGFKRKILIRGNHDNKSYSWYYNHGWDFVCESMRLRVFGKEIVFSHMPILAENIENSPYKKVDKNIHGHLHGAGKYSHRAIDGYEAGFHFDCAVDTNNYNVIDLEKII